MHLCYSCNANFHESLTVCPACGGKRFARVAGSVPAPAAAPSGTAPAPGMAPLSALPPVAPTPGLLGAGFWSGLGLVFFGANMLPLLGSSGLTAPALALVGLVQVVFGAALIAHQPWADKPARAAAAAGALAGLVGLGSLMIYGPLGILWYALVAALGGISVLLYRHEEQAAHWSWLLMGLTAGAALRLGGIAIIWGQGALHPDPYWRSDLANRVAAPDMLKPGKDGGPTFHDRNAECSFRVPAGWAGYTREQMFTLTPAQQMLNRHREAEPPKFACDPGDPRLILVIGAAVWDEGKLADLVELARVETASALEIAKDDRDAAVSITPISEEDFKTDSGVPGHLKVFGTPDGRRHFFYLVRPEDGSALVLDGVDLGNGDAQRIFDGIAHSVTADPGRTRRRHEDLEPPPGLPMFPPGVGAPPEDP